MKVDYIAPCICITEPPDYIADSSVGMPEISMHGNAPYKYYFSAFCPKCGRGSKMEDCRSTYYALKHWNNLQRGLWQDRVCNFWTGEYLDTAKPWEIGIYERIRSKCFTLELIVERMEVSE